MQIKTIYNNPLEVKTYILYDDTNEAVIIDPGVGTLMERDRLRQFVADKGLTVKYVIGTHPHIDHVVGFGYCKETFGAPLLMNADGMKVYDHSVAYGVAFGMDCDKKDFPQPDQFIKEGDRICFGHEVLEVIETPGHCAGSVCLYHRASGSLFVGDLVFRNSVGRSDLPTGNTQALIDSIRYKILPLPENTMLYVGHGDNTTIEHEKRFNSFFQIES
ncbi:MAG: MBL fold metallo-hydrolase [Bacteroidales bacterium]|jgi:glyoxylase-like metal-dependent hydrolase (beta-lactamase superfamily II)|nr:MBL fold metallo-hydrolase [Bacteroidales bacterium]